MSEGAKLQAIPWPQHVTYAASKGGVQMLVESLTQELAPAKIRVNAVAPGAIRTTINRKAWETPAGRRDLGKRIPYGRIGYAEDIARAVAWLTSDASGYVGDTTLVLDGGMMLSPGLRGHADGFVATANATEGQ